MSTPALPTVTLYTRAGCHLCERVETLLHRARHEAMFDLSVTDIDANPALRERYHLEVPVVAINGLDLFNHAIDYHAFLNRIRTAR